MEYRQLPHGNKNEKFSVLGLGMGGIGKTPPDEIEAIIRKAVDNGINFFDLCTAGASYAPIGRAIRDCRDKVFLQTHFGAVYDENGEYGWCRDFDTIKKTFLWELEALCTDYVDFGFLHCVDEDEDFDKLCQIGVLDYLKELKEKGVVRHIGFSSHTPSVANRIIDTGLVDMMMFSINPAYDFEKGDEYGIGSVGERFDLFKRCESEGIGISVMKPFFAGQLLSAEQSPFGVALTHAQCLQYAIDRPGVLTVVPGVQTMEHLDTLLEFLSASEEEKDYSVIATFTADTVTGTCVYCNHCQPCPAGIDIGLVNKYYDLALAGDRIAANHYTKLSVKADACLKCGHCESRCPFNVKQESRMAEIDSYFKINNYYERSENMVKNYDAVVIGAGNGGLVAAARLAKEGKKTLLIERHNLPGGFATSFVRGRFEFEASLHELCGVGSITGKSPLLKIFQEVGAADKIEWVALDEAFRLITLDENNKCDYSMPLGKEAFIAKLNEYDPGSAAVVSRIFDLIESIEKTLDFVSNIEDFKPSMIKEIFSEHTDFLKVANYSVDEVLKSFGASKITRDILNGYWCYLGQPTDELNVIHYFTMLHSYIIDGAVIPRGRSHQISTALLEAFTENGGEAWFNTSVTKINVTNGVATGVVLEDGTQINAKAVICNASPYNAYTKLIDENAVPEKLKKEVNAKTLGAKGFAVFLGLNRSAEEIGLDNHTYFIYPTNDNRKCYELSKKIETNDVQATVCLNKAFDDCSPEGTSILYMTSIFAGDEWSKVSVENYHKTKISFAEKMIDNFEKATGVKIRDYIEEIEISTPMTYARYTDAPAGTIYGYEASKEDGIVKRIVFDMIDKGISGLYFAGGYTTRHMGYSPSYTTGDMAAKAAILAMDKEAK